MIKGTEVKDTKKKSSQKPAIVTSRIDQNKGMTNPRDKIKMYGTFGHLQAVSNYDKEQKNTVKSRLYTNTQTETDRQPFLRKAASNSRKTISPDKNLVVLGSSPLKNIDKRKTESTRDLLTFDCGKLISPNKIRTNGKLISPDKIGTNPELMISPLTLSPSN